MNVRVPVCQRHRGYWSANKKFLYFAGSLFVFGVLGLILFGLAIEVDKALNGKAGGLMCVALILGPLLWFASIPLLNFIGTRPIEITERSITLTKVSPAFVEAVAEDRETPAPQRQEDGIDASPHSQPDDEGDDPPPSRPQSIRQRPET